MNTLNEMLAQARQSHESLKYLVQSMLAQGDAEDATADLDALLRAVSVLEKLDEFSAGTSAQGHKGIRFESADLVRHNRCGRFFEDDEDYSGVTGLLGLVHLAESHVCLPEAEKESGAEKAKAAMLAAYKDAVGLNIFDTKTWPLVLKAHEYVHAIVRDERDKVSSGHALPDLDRVVRLTDPENIWGAR